MAPNAPPSVQLVALIIAGGLFVSGAGCIANDLWDRRIDKKVARTQNRPLAQGTVNIPTALGLLLAMLLLSFLVLISLPAASTQLCLLLAIIALPAIFLYPSAKRWFAYPQAILSICWGFAVLIPWAASESSISGNLPLLFCWSATFLWTFGFDTVYAMADKNDDAKLELKSSVLTLGEKATRIVAISYAMSTICLAIGAGYIEIGWIFWPIWIVAALGMQREVLILKETKEEISKFGRHFKNQVWLGGLLLLGLILGRAI